jgi:hypothetical protein
VRSFCVQHKLDPRARASRRVLCVAPLPRRGSAQGRGLQPEHRRRRDEHAHARALPPEEWHQRVLDLLRRKPVSGPWRRTAAAAHAAAASATASAAAAEPLAHEDVDATRPRNGARASRPRCTRPRTPLPPPRAQVKKGRKRGKRSMFRLKKPFAHPVSFLL